MKPVATRVRRRERSPHTGLLIAVTLVITCPVAVGLTSVRHGLGPQWPRKTRRAGLGLIVAVGPTVAGPFAAVAGLDRPVVPIAGEIPCGPCPSDIPPAACRRHAAMRIVVVPVGTERRAPPVDPS